MSDSSVAMKVCRLCQAEKPATLEFFYARSTAHGTLIARCKTCFDAIVKGVAPEAINPGYIEPARERRACLCCGKAYTISPSYAHATPKSGLYCSRTCRRKGPSDVPHDPEMQLVPLFGKDGEGKFAFVSPEDYSKVMEYRWVVHTTYVKSKSYVDGKIVLLHHFIMGRPDGFVVDHIDGDKLNNQRENLRVCTALENRYNRRKQSTPASSQFKGVYRNNKRDKWKAEVAKDGKIHYLGTFVSEIEAAKAYDAKALELFGEFAKINFPVG